VGPEHPPLGNHEHQRVADVARSPGHSHPERGRRKLRGGNVTREDRETRHLIKRFFFISFLDFMRILDLISNFYFRDFLFLL
jgi:hypothetical protein